MAAVYAGDHSLQSLLQLNDGVISLPKAASDMEAHRTLIRALPPDALAVGDASAILRAAAKMGRAEKPAISLIFDVDTFAAYKTAVGPGQA